MGSLSLECPLCCTEKFPSFHSLKYHLLSIVDNLICSSCNERFSNVRELIDHLDMECCGNKKVQSTVKKEETDMEEAIEKTVLAKALLKKPEEETAMEETSTVEMIEADTDDEETTAELYECSTCQVQFASIEDHIREFHAGSEVVIQVSFIYEKKQ